MSVSVLTAAVRSDQVLQDRLPISMEKYAAKLDPNAAIFEAISRKVNGIETKNRMKHEFRELRLMPDVVTVTAAAAAGATTISVSNPTYFRDDDLIYCPSTREVFACGATPSSSATTITVRRKDAATGTGIVSAIASGSILINLKESHAEGESEPAARAWDQEAFSTYIYQFDEVVKHTDIQVNEEDYGQNKLDEDREQAMIQTLRAINQMMYWGSNTREVLSAAGPRRHIMAGLEYYLWSRAVNANNIVGGLTMAALGEIIRGTKSYGASSAVKLAIHGTNSWATISAYPNSAVRTEPGRDKEWGVTVSRLITPFGEIDNVYDQSLCAEKGTADRMFILDIKYVKQLQMRGLPLVMKRNIKGDTDPHNITDLITGTRGMMLQLPELHREVYNVS